jgi:hypothetical protein
MSDNANSKNSFDVISKNRLWLLRRTSLKSHQLCGDAQRNRGSRPRMGRLALNALDEQGRVDARQQSLFKAALRASNSHSFVPRIMRRMFARASFSLSSQY